MAGSKVNGSEGQARSGAPTLLLLATPLVPLLLRSLAGGPRQQVELRHEVGAPAQSTLRAQLRRLDELGIVEKQRRNSFPGTLRYELSPSGRELLTVVAVLERWLADAPDTLSLGEGAAKAAIRALAGSWSTAMLRALAARPLSLTQLDRMIVDLSYPALERRLAALRVSGQIEALSANGRGTPYALTDWARLGSGPIVAAARWERRNLPSHAPPIGRIEAETFFLLTPIPLPADDRLTGACRLATELPRKEGRRLAGAIVDVRAGKIASRTPSMRESATAWALGSPGAWLEALGAGDIEAIERGGDARLARAIVDSLHRALLCATSASAP